MKYFIFLVFVLTILGCDRPIAQSTSITVEEVFEVKTHLAKGKPVVVDFHATWCVPCHQFEPEFKQWAEKHPEAIFLKVDIDKATQLAKDYKVEFVPSVIVMKGDKVFRLTQYTEANLLAAIKAVE